MFRIQELRCVAPDGPTLPRGLVQLRVVRVLGFRAFWLFRVFRAPRPLTLKRANPNPFQGPKALNPEKG